MMSGSSPTVSSPPRLSVDDPAGVETIPSTPAANPLRGGGLLMGTFASETTCRCGATVEVRTVQTEVPGSLPISMFICVYCDRRKACSACGHIDATGTARRCRCGRSITLSDLP